MTAGSSSVSPLFGRVVALTRPRDRIGPLVRAFAAAGAETIICPVLRLVPVEGNARTELEETLRTFVEGGAGWLALTSGSVVPVIATMLAADPDFRDRVTDRMRVAAIGGATAEAARSRGIAIVLEGSGAGAERLASQILAEDPRPRVLHVTSDRGLDTLRLSIEAGGGTATRAIAVEHRLEPTLDPRMLFTSRPAGLIVFASPSAAEGLLSACSEKLRARTLNIPALAFGETTARALAAFGFEEVCVASAPTPGALVAAAIERL